MRRVFAFYELLIAVGILGAILAPQVSYCQKASSTAPTPTEIEAGRNSTTVDSLFTEIKLDPDGVTAIGENGAFHRYDFEADSFAVVDRISVNGVESEGGFSRNFEPVEERCVERVDVPPFSENVVIGETEFVEGDIIALGRVTVKGWVKGSVRSLNRRVLVTESGRVDGDVEAPEVSVKDGGVILGDHIEMDAEDATNAGDATVSEEGLGVTFGFTLFFLILGFVLLSIIPHRMERFENCITRYRWRSLLIGLVLIILLPFLIVIASITIIGIPIAVALPIVFIYAGAVGAIITGMRISRYLTQRFLPSVRQKMAHLALGIPLFMLMWLLVAIFLGTPDEASQGFGIFLLVLSIAASTYAVASGVGAAFLTRLGSRDYITLRDKVFGEPSAPAPAPPPKPDFQPNAPSPPPKADSQGTA